MYKKRWYDGLHDIYEDKNEFEIKFGCFGGDGGGSKSGPKKDPQPPADSTPVPDDGFRGEQSTAAKAAADAAKAAAKAEIEANLAGKAQAAQNIQNQIADVISGTQKGPVDVGGPKGLSIATPAEQLAGTRTPQQIADSVSLANLSTGPVNAPTTQTGLLDLTTPVGLAGSAIAPSLQKGFANVQKAVIDQVMDPDQRALAAAREAIAQGKNPFATSTKDDLAKQLATPNTNRATQNFLDYQANAPVQRSDGKQPGISVNIPAGANVPGFGPNPGIQVDFTTPIGPQTSVTPDVTRSGVMSALGVPGSYQTAAVAPTTVTSPINDPTAQAGVGSFFTETVPGVFGFSPPTKGKSKSSKTKSAADRFKGTKVRTKPVGVGEYFTNLFTG